MKRALTVFAGIALLLCLLASSAQASFGLKGLDVTFTAENGSPEMQAGSHPFATTVRFDVNTIAGGTNELPDESPKDVLVELPPGLIGKPDATPRCPTVDFTTINREVNLPACADSTALGLAGIRVAVGAGNQPREFIVPAFNLVPPPGKALKLGFIVLGVPVVVEGGLSHEPPYNVLSGATNITQTLDFFGSRLTLWGNPADPAHDPYRGSCDDAQHARPLPGEPGAGLPASTGLCPVSTPEVPLLTMPTSCTGPITTVFEGDSWQHPGPPYPFRATVESHDASIPSNPLGVHGCSKLGFSPRIESQLTTSSGETGSGLDFNLDFNDQGLLNPDGNAQSTIKKAVVTLPAGVTINPSVGEGLGVCTPADLKRETVDSLPGEGCPQASNLGSLRVDSPLVEEPVEGSIFLAQQDDPGTTAPGAENPFDSLIALYFVLKNPTLGVILKLPVKVEPDPNTGQLVVTLDDNPQVPFSHFNAHLRTGARAALVSPAACGTHELKASLTPWASPTQPLVTTASFQITRGVNGGPCPPGGVPPFHPEFQAGAVNNNAGSFSPFNMRLIRKDGEQDMTKFSSILPPGELGSLAGVDKCPDAAIAIAKSKTGKQELASPSCPANSLIGHTLAGAGVGDALTYVGGQLYLGGPYKGDPLSVISITPAVAGPFDAGTVVVRLALTLNPKTAEVEVDGANSDPIPHILKGIVLKVRDLRVYVDRPNFLLNPTSCDPSSVKATLFGSFLDVFNPADDVPVDLAARYQAANCLNLGFKPKLNLNLKGGTKRAGHPGLKALYKPRKGDANVEGLVVRLPRSAFLDQAHIRTICTRVQFAADTCPPAAQYGYIKAWTPLLEEPLQGPVWLRSSNHKLPDLVFDLHGLVDVEVATRIDSAKGGIRATVEDAPDAPLSKVELRMQGGKKGLIINSRNLCDSISKANVQFSGHNGKQSSANPVMQADGCGKRKSKR
jgi:hypothetical protein